MNKILYCVIHILFFGIEQTIYFLPNSSVKLGKLGKKLGKPYREGEADNLFFHNHNTDIFLFTVNFLNPSMICLPPNFCLISHI